MQSKKRCGVSTNTTRTIITSHSTVILVSLELLPQGVQPHRPPYSGSVIELKYAGEPFRQAIRYAEERLDIGASRCCIGVRTPHAT